MTAEIIMMCFEFFKAGLFAIGGGLVTLPFFYEMADKYNWFTSEDIANMIAISEATPGPFGINMATFAGYKAFGIFGSILAVFFMILPSFVIIIIVSKFLDHFSDNKYVKDSFLGLRPGVCALVMNAWLSIVKVTLVDPSAISINEINLFSFFKIVPLILFILFFLGNRYIKKLPPAAWIAIGAFFGFLFL